MTKQSKVEDGDKSQLQPQVVVIPGGAALASQPDFMEALHAFQYGESAEESDEGFRNMVGIASKPKEADGDE